MAYQQGDTITAADYNNFAANVNTVIGTGSGAKGYGLSEVSTLSAGATILGNVEIGKNAKVAAGSVVLTNVKEGTTVAGVPAKVVSSSKSDIPSYSVDHLINLNK